MKVCLQCAKETIAKDWLCQHCGHKPQSNGAFICLSEEQEFDHKGFDPVFFSKLCEFEDDHWWFKSRSELIIKAIKGAAPKFKKYLEIGCGTGVVLREVANQFPGTEKVGTEYFLEGLSYARRRVESAILYQMDGRSIPFIDHFEIVGIFDVLEHIEEDQRVLQQIYQSLASNGVLVLTVPQHKWMWSERDVRAHHIRRYSRSELIRKIEAAGFKITLMHSFVSLLLPVMWLSRLRYRVKAEFKSSSELKVSGFTNQLFKLIMLFEKFLIGINIRLPFGGSILLVARKS